MQTLEIRSRDSRSGSSVVLFLSCACAVAAIWTFFDPTIGDRGLLGLLSPDARIVAWGCFAAVFMLIRLRMRKTGTLLFDEIQATQNSIFGRVTTRWSDLVRIDQVKYGGNALLRLLEPKHIGPLGLFRTRIVIPVDGMDKNHEEIVGFLARRRPDLMATIT